MKKIECLVLFMIAILFISGCATIPSPYLVISPQISGQEGNEKCKLKKITLLPADLCIFDEDKIYPAERDKKTEQTLFKIESTLIYYLKKRNYEIISTDSLSKEVKSFIYPTFVEFRQIILEYNKFWSQVSGRERKDFLLNKYSLSAKEIIKTSNADALLYFLALDWSKTATDFQKLVKFLTGVRADIYFYVILIDKDGKVIYFNGTTWYRQEYMIPNNIKNLLASLPNVID